MKNKYITSFYCFLLAGLVLAACYPEQDVEPVDSPENNPVVTITPVGDYSSVSEGDTLTFKISVDKMIRYSLSFDVALRDGSVADGDDFVSEGATLPPFTTSTEISFVIVPDAEPEEDETIAFEFSRDYHWDWQINPETGKETFSSTIKDMTFSLDWSAGTYNGADLCEAGVDLDLYLVGDEINDFTGATGSCPVEYGTLGIPVDGTYKIIVEYYDSEIPVDEHVEIPYVVSFKGGAFTIEGSFDSALDEDDPARAPVVGKLVVSGDTKTIYDAADNELGTL